MTGEEKGIKARILVEPKEIGYSWPNGMMPENLIDSYEYSLSISVDTKVISTYINPCSGAEEFAKALSHCLITIYPQIIPK